MAGIRKEIEGQRLHRADDMAEWRRRQDLYRAYDGPVPPRMMARAGDGEARLEGLIRDGEERAARYDTAAEKWLGLGKPGMARRCREDAKLARDTAALNRDVLDKLRADRAGACPGRDPGAGETGVAEQGAQSPGAHSGCRGALAERSKPLRDLLGNPSATGEAA